MAVAPSFNRTRSDDYLHVVPSLMRCPSIHPTYPAPPYSCGRPPIYSPQPARHELRIAFPPPVHSTRTSTNTTVTEIFGHPRDSFLGQMSSSQRILRELREDKHLLHDNSSSEEAARYLFWLGFIFPLLWAIGSLLVFLRPGEDRSVWVDATSPTEATVDLTSTESLTVIQPARRQWARRCLYAWVLCLLLAGCIVIILSGTRVGVFARH